jgi:pyridoxal phosphate enzyme (YggS family)
MKKRDINILGKIMCKASKRVCYFLSTTATTGGFTILLRLAALKVLYSKLAKLRRRSFDHRRTALPLSYLTVPVPRISAYHLLPTTTAHPDSEPCTDFLPELLKKAAILPREIEWHLIGALQTNKCRDVARLIPNLWAVESVDTKEKAEKLEIGRKMLRSSNRDAKKLRVYVQVNTSGEASKSGCDPKDAITIAECIIKECENLTLHGLMTIGSFTESTGEDENKDFKKLVGVKEEVENQLKEGGLELPRGLELSMGMSEDFEEAVKQGANNVRVGTAIFGERLR